MDPILIDECLSPYLAGVAKERGYLAMHVAWLNREGTDDRSLAMLAAERDYSIPQVGWDVPASSWPGLSGPSLQALVPRQMARTSRTMTNRAHDAGSPISAMSQPTCGLLYIIVTNNRRDFLRIYAQLEVHNGLIIIIPTVPADEQCRLFNVVLDTADRQDSLINLLIEVRADGTVEVRNWSKDRAAVRCGSGGNAWSVNKPHPGNADRGTLVGGDGFEPPTLSV